MSFFCNPSGLGSGACIQSYREGDDACARINKGQWILIGAVYHTSIHQTVEYFLRNSAVKSECRTFILRLVSWSPFFLLDIDLLGETPVEETFSIVTSACFIRGWQAAVAGLLSSLAEQVGASRIQQKSWRDQGWTIWRTPKHARLQGFTISRCRNYKSMISMHIIFITWSTIGLCRVWIMIDDINDK